MVAIPALRPYQLAAVDAVEGAFAAAYRSALLVHATGAGKTTSATEVIRRHLGRAQGARPSAVLVLAHRRELLAQFRDRLTAFGIASALARGAANARRALRAVLESRVRVVVASVQTMARRLAAEPEAWPADVFDLVVVDEAQHAPAHGYRNILSHFPRARVLGLTATPDRLDQVALGTVFQHLAHRYDLQEAVAAGYLCRARGVRVDVEGLDLSRVRQKIVRGTGGVPAHAVRDAAGAPAAPGAAKTPDAGHADLPAASVGEVRDLHPGDLGRAFIAPQAVEGVVGPLLELTENRRTIVFAVDRAHAAALTEALAARGAAAVVVHGGMRAQDRAAALDAFRAGEAQFCVNVQVLCLDAETELLTSEGWVGVDEISPTHKVANWDDYKVTFEVPEAVFIRERAQNERMVSLDSPRMSIRVTEGHQMLYRTHSEGRFLKVAALDLVGKQVKLPVSGYADPSRCSVEQASFKRPFKIAVSQAKWNLVHLEGRADDVSTVQEAVRRVQHKRGLRRLAPTEITEDHCRLIGFWLGDGSINKLIRSGVEYTLCQSMSNQSIVRWIDALIGRCQLHYVRREFEYVVPHVRWSLPRGTGGGSQERKGVYPIEQYLIKQGSQLYWGFNEKQFDALIEGFWFADGDHRDGTPISPKRSLTLHNANHQLLSLLQAIAVTRGYGTHLYKGGVPRATNHQQMWMLTLRKKDDFHIGTYKMQLETAWKPEKVWCVQVRTRNIITRRRGSVLVMGNCEGFDMPEIECVALARPTQSRIFVAQAIGRALRPHESKDHALVLDFTSATSRFSLVGPADVLGGDGMLGPVTRYARRAGAGVVPYAASRRWRARFTTWVVDLLRRVTGRELREGAGGGGADGKRRGRAVHGARGGVAALARRAWVWLVG